MVKPIQTTKNDSETWNHVKKTSTVMNRMSYAAYYMSVFTQEIQDKTLKNLSAIIF